MNTTWFRETLLLLDDDDDELRLREKLRPLKNVVFLLRLTALLRLANRATDRLFDVVVLDAPSVLLSFAEIDLYFFKDPLFSLESRLLVLRFLQNDVLMVFKSCCMVTSSSRRRDLEN
jgi:hypothetical protein